MKRRIRMEWSYSQYYKIETHKHPDTRRDNVYTYQSTGWGNLIFFFSATCLRSECGSFIFIFFLIETINVWKTMLACALKLGKIVFFFLLSKILFWISIVLRRFRTKRKKVVRNSSLFSNRQLWLSMSTASNKLSSSEKWRPSVSAVQILRLKQTNEKKNSVKS